MDRWITWRRLCRRAALGLLLTIPCCAAWAGGGSGVPGLIPVDGSSAVDTSVNWQGVNREVIVLAPDPLPTTPMPVAIMLHYDGGTPLLMANLTSAGRLAASMGFLVLLPNAINYHWNDDPGDPTQPSDDVGFLNSLAKTFSSQYSIDSKRVSVMGYSNGGFMALRMACQSADTIASAVVVAGLLRTTLLNACQPSRPLPVMLALGTADPVVDYDGYGTVLGAPGAMVFWAGLSSCNLARVQNTALPVSVNDGTSVNLQKTQRCSSYGEVDLYTVNGGGHTWPGASFQVSGLGVTSQNLDMTMTAGSFALRWNTRSTH